MRYRRILQSSDSYEENPCYDCCFGDKETGECLAPSEIINSDEDCGFDFTSEHYIYEEIK